MTPEAKLTAAVIRELKRLRAAGEPVKWLKVVGHPSIESGTPDLLIVYRGRPVFVELKAPGGKPTMLQLKRLEEWGDAGAVCGVCRSVGDVLRLLNPKTEGA